VFRFRKALYDSNCPNGTDRTREFRVSVSVHPLIGKAKSQLTQTSKLFEGSRNFYKKADQIGIAMRATTPIASACFSQIFAASTITSRIMLFIIAVKPREVKSVMQNLKKIKAYKVAANLFVK